jgi:hypothetical protein
VTEKGKKKGAYLFHQFGEAVEGGGEVDVVALGEVRRHVGQQVLCARRRQDLLIEGVARRGDVGGRGGGGGGGEGG